MPKYKKIGFYFEGTFITDPFTDETNIKNVNPYEYYGKHYVLSPFFTPMEKTNPKKMFEVIVYDDTAGCDDTPEIDIVPGDYFEDHGFPIETNNIANALGLDEKYSQPGFIIKRII